MRKLLAGTLALGVVGVSAIGWAGTSSAQLPEPQIVQLGLTLSADVVDPGQDITVSPEACTPDPDAEAEATVLWVWYDAEDADPFDEGEVAMAEDGSWELTFTTPSQPGEYWFSAYCLPAGFEGDEAEFEACFPDEVEPFAATEGEEHGTTTVVEEPEFDCLFEYYETMFTVAGEAPPEEPTAPEPGPRPAPPQAAPATPVPGDPGYTG